MAMVSVVTLFALVALAAALPSCAPSTLTTLHTQALASCGLAPSGSLAELQNPSLFFAPGSTTFCDTDCVTAVAALFDAADYCGGSTLDSAVGAPVYATLYNLVIHQAACAPPSATCLRVYHDFVRWQTSAEGSVCMQALPLLEAVVANATTQAQNALFCEGRCGAGLSFYVAKLEQQGCAGGWAAYTRLKIRSSRACLTVGSNPKTYCATTFSFLRARSDLEIAADSNVAAATREAALGRLCTPCYYQYVRNVSAYSGGNTLQLLIEMERTCLADFVQPATTRFCLPRFENALQAGNQNNLTLQMCQASMGNCASKMYSRLAVSSTSTAAAAAAANLHVRYQCARSADRSLCGALVTSVTQGFVSNGSFVGQAFYGPSNCMDISTGDFCTWGCQRRFGPVRSAFQCCFTLSQQYYAALNLSGTNTAFSRAATVGNECADPMEAACVLNSTASLVTTSLTLPVPHAWAVSTWSTLKSIVLVDLAKLSGRPQDTLNITELNGGSDGSAVITFTITHQETVDSQAVADGLAADAAAGRLVFLETARQYAQRCLGDACSSAFTLLPSFVFALALIAFALFA